MPQSMVHIENLVKRYGDLTALNHLELDIREGEIFGLLGPNGSGKTTAISCLLSLLKYDRGEIKIFGEEMKPDSYKLKEQIGIVLQNVAVFDELTVQENIDYFCGYAGAGCRRIFCGQKRDRRIHRTGRRAKAEEFPMGKRTGECGDEALGCRQRPGGNRQPEGSSGRFR